MSLRSRQLTLLDSTTRHDATSSDDYYTPPEVFDALQLTFDLDVASPVGGVPWIPVKRYLTIEDDSLTHEWDGRIWMNPPFSNTAPFADRFIEHRNGVALLPTSRAQWFGRLWVSEAAIVHPVASPMFTFVRNGQRQNIYMPVIFAAFGEDCINALSRIGKVR